jgi:hypothetical protein
VINPLIDCPKAPQSRVPRNARNLLFHRSLNFSRDIVRPVVASFEFRHGDIAT